MVQEAHPGRVLPAGVIEDHLYSLRTRGYSVIPDFLSQSDTIELRSRLQRGLEAYRPRVGVEQSHLDRYQLHDLCCQDIAFARLLDDERLQSLIAPILGDYWVMYAFTSSSLPPGGTNYARRIHVDSPRHVPGYPFNVGVVWVIDAFSEQSGATEVLPGSQASEREPSESYFESNWVRVDCPSGGLIVFDARLYHRTGVNRTNAWRHALTLNACRPFMKQRMDWVRFVPESIARQLGPQGRRLLGYDTRVPSSLDEFFLPPDSRLYKPGQG